MVSYGSKKIKRHSNCINLYTLLQLVGVSGQHTPSACMWGDITAQPKVGMKHAFLVQCVGTVLDSLLQWSVAVVGSGLPSVYLHTGGNTLIQ